jgi:ATP-dependent exoDNAse (exonuclease V) alpha subunit
VIIDEVSMVRADVMDAVDYALRLNRKDKRPFGGVQMVLVGDFRQLPPVVTPSDAALLTQMGYATPYALSAKCLNDKQPMVIELQTVYRQDDPEFLRLLGNIRSGEDVAATIDTLNRACYGAHKRAAKPVILTGTNAIADRYNHEGMAALTGKEHIYHGVIKGDFKLTKDKLPVPESLTLKVGARVMLVKNDKEKQWVNGSLGTIKRCEKASIEVQLDGQKDTVDVTPVSWENIRYQWQEKQQKIEADVVGSYTHMPLVPAWAVTIHKAQGLTLDNVRIDLSTGAFTSGQAYVALSRARSLDGLSFASPLRANDIIVDKMLPCIPSPR